MVPLPGAAEPAPSSSHSWLAALRARLGLPGAPTLRAMLEDALKGAGDGRAFSAEEREMLLRILRFGALRVVDVMVPRADIIAVDENEPVWELLKTFDAAGVSRLPLFRETLDDPRGMVHVKDVMRWLIGEALGRPASEGHVQSAAVACSAAATGRRCTGGACGRRPGARARQPVEAHRLHQAAPADDLRAAVDAGRQSAHSHAVDAHPHGAGGRRVRRHRRPRHHRGPGRADRRRHRGRARRGGGRQHRR